MHFNKRSHELMRIQCFSCAVWCFVGKMYKLYHNVAYRWSEFEVVACNKKLAVNSCQNWMCTMLTEPLLWAIQRTIHVFVHIIIYYALNAFTCTSAQKHCVSHAVCTMVEKCALCSSLHFPEYSFNLCTLVDYCFRRISLCMRVYCHCFAASLSKLSAIY